MKYRLKVIGEWFVEMDVETGTGEPFDNYESELKEEMQIQAERYETRLEVQELEYRDELIEVQEEHQMDKDELSKVRQELRGKQFEFDMATNRIEQLNKEIGEGGQHD